MFKKINSISCAGLLLLVVCGFTLKPQEINDTRLTLDSNWLVAPPIQIVEIYRNHEKISPMVAFTGYDGWYRDLRIRVKNISSAQIKYIELSLHFPAKDSQGNYYLPEHKIMAGKNYAQKRQAVDDTGELILDPNDTVNMAFTPHNYDAFARRISNVPPEVIKSVKLKVTAVVFADLDTGWIRGLYMKRDRDNDGRWVPDRDRISKNFGPATSVFRDGLPLQSAGTSQVSEQFGYNFTGKDAIVRTKKVVLCYTPFDVLHPTCRGEACTSNCVADSPRSNIVSNGYDEKQVCVQCYNGTSDCDINCKYSVDEIDYSHNCHSQCQVYTPSIGEVIDIKQK